MTTTTVAGAAERLARRTAVFSGAAVAGAVVVLVAFRGAVPAGIVIQGMIFGTGTGLLGVGLVLIYRSTRIVNFAYGAMGGLPATIAVSLYLGRNWPWFVVVVVAVVVGAGIGVIVERLVIRRFTNSSRLVLTVATIGLAQVLGGLEIVVPRLIGGQSLVGSFQTPLNDISVTVEPVVITGNDLFLLTAVPVVLIALSWFLLRTDSGIAVRGVADNRERAQLLGIPVDRLGAIVWGIAGALAAGTVLLSAPSKGLVIDAAAGPQLLLPALAAAVIAGMDDLKRAFLAGLGLGVVDQLVQWNFRQASATTVVFFFIVLVALLVQRRSIARSSTALGWSGGARNRLPEHVRALPQVKLAKVIALAGLIIVAITLPLLASSSQVSRMSGALIAGILVASLVMLTGWSGSVSLGQFAIAGVGGLVAANLLTRLGMDLFLALLVAAAAGGAIALVIGLPGLRLNGLFLGVTTLAFAIVVDAYMLNPVNFPEALPGSIDRPVLWQRFPLSSERTLYYFTLGALVVTCLLVYGIRKARTGRVLLAIRDNDRAAAAAGVATTRTRLSAFVMTGMIAGLAGGVQVVLLGGIGVHSFQPSESLLLFSMAVIGGIESIGGALIGVALVQLASYLFPDYQLVITGTGLLLVLLIMPRGLTEVIDRVGVWCGLKLAGDRAVLAEDDEDAHVDFLVAPSKVADGSSLERIEAGPAAPPRPAPPEPERLDPTAAANVAPETRPLLDCNGITASYGQMQVLFGVDFVAYEGEIVALLGTNGAGKSTFLNCVTGLMKPGAGAITFAGEKLVGCSPEDIAKRGIALMPGGRGLFPTLTVAENMRLGSWLLRDVPATAAAEREKMLDLMPVLRDRLDLRAGELSGGEQQMLSMAMALSTRPKVLCIDELSIGLAPTIVSRLAEQVRQIRDAGTTVVLVEQSVSVALMLAERAEFIEKGEIHFSGRTEDLLSDPEVLASVFVGDAESAAVVRQSAAQHTPSVKGRAGEALECRGLTKRYGGITAVNNVSLTFEPGTITGIIGHNGAGKTTLFDLLTGFLRPDGGRIFLAGEDITDQPSHRRAIEGLGRSFQEARLYPGLTVRETLAVGLDMHVASHDPVAAAFQLPASVESELLAWERVDELLHLLDLDDMRDRLTSELSTGTRRLVELACILAQEPQVVLLDEPGGGVAQRDMEGLIPLLQRVQRASGCAMALIDHNMNLMTAVCDEFVAMELGSVITRGTPPEVLSHPAVIASYLGTEESEIPRVAAAQADFDDPASVTSF
ncbi:MAG: ATP-binding cassette domain-containing protein [Actinobacteria bacterium]|nr:ATP-binding cassette domain-containing protein [Actinomycetota bacterium]